MEGVKAELLPPSNNNLEKIQINSEENIFELIDLCLYEDFNKNIDENLILFNPKIKLANYLGNYGGLIAAKIWTNEELTKHIIIDILPKVEAIKTIIEREPITNEKQCKFKAIKSSIKEGLALSQALESFINPQSDISIQERMEELNKTFLKANNGLLRLGILNEVTKNKCECLQEKDNEDSRNIFRELTGREIPEDGSFCSTMSMEQCKEEDIEEMSLKLQARYFDSSFRGFNDLQFNLLRKMSKLFLFYFKIKENKDNENEEINNNFNIQKNSDNSSESFNEKIFEGNSRDYKQFCEEIVNYWINNITKYGMFVLPNNEEEKNNCFWLEKDILLNKCNTNFGTIKLKMHDVNTSSYESSKNTSLQLLNEADNILNSQCNEEIRNFTKIVLHTNFAEKMKLLRNSHRCIVHMIGCISIPDATLGLVLEFCSNGNLLNYLRKLSEEQQKLTKENKIKIEKENERIISVFMRFSWQICDGMKFLTEKQIIHRDLAARNILLDDYMITK
uniref:Protein kinase domain-containing protein n=1 Tax=Meloidogyne javanica TaxID=6303 RepID=A0A915LLV2_MELJA